MANAGSIQRVGQQSIKVAVDVSKGIMVHARGNPATIVSVAAAAGIAFVAAGVGAGAYYGGKAVYEKVRG
jgi:hypothetical protein